MSPLEQRTVYQDLLVKRSGATRDELRTVARVLRAWYAAELVGFSRDCRIEWRQLLDAIESVRTPGA